MNKELIEKIDNILDAIYAGDNDDSYAQEIINLCADKAIDAVNEEQLSGETDCPEDTAYSNALDNAIESIEKRMK